MSFAQTIRERIASGSLPRRKPTTVVRTDGTGKICAACDAPIPLSYPQIEFESGELGKLRFHLGCYALWIAVLIDGGWLDIM